MTKNWVADNRVIKKLWFVQRSLGLIISCTA